MAGITIDALFGVRARLPLFHDARSGRRVAFDAGFAGLGDLRRLRVKKKAREENQEDGEKMNTHEPSMKQFHLGRSAEADCISMRSVGGGLNRICARGAG
jgi:hypothetical protein